MPATNNKFQHLSNTAKNVANERVYAMLDESEQKQIEHMTEIFNAIDVKKDGFISLDEFRRYVQKNPKGWPLVDLFRAKTMNQNERDLLVNFVFRKLDHDASGKVSFEDFISMFYALRNTKTQESLYVDFLINLYDENMDGRIDRAELTKMMHVLFGEEPPQVILDWMPEEGMDRDQLTRALHSISMDFQLLPSSQLGMQSSNSGMFTAGVTESRVWNTQSGMFEVSSASNLATPNVSSPNTNEGGKFIPTAPSASPNATNSNDSRKSAKKEAAIERNRQKKNEEDRISIATAIAITAAVTAGICVFVGVYARKVGHL